MRLTSTGLGIGTSSPSTLLHISGVNPIALLQETDQAANAQRWGIQSELSLFKVRAFNDAMSSAVDLLIGDRSGNLGLGVTPSAWGGGFGVGFTLPNGNLFSTSTVIGISNNGYRDTSGFWRYMSSAASTRLEMDRGAFSFGIAPSGTAGNIITFTQAMTLDADGDLGVGTTSPTTVSNYRAITVNGTNGGILDLKYGDTLGGRVVASSGGLSLETGGANVLTFYTNTTERARITSGGYFKASNNGTYFASTGVHHELYSNASSDWISYFTQATATSPNGVVIQYTAAAPNGTGNPFLYCQDTAVVRASIRSNGGIANYQGNDANLSDRREKTNFAPAKSYLDTICAIPVQTFNYIDQSENDPGLTLGVVAQDVQAVAPELVTESDWSAEKDGSKMRLSIYQTDLQYALMKCIQELKSELDSVKAELATLKGN
jgi:hypothetical protein